MNICKKENKLNSYNFKTLLFVCDFLMNIPLDFFVDTLPKFRSDFSFLVK